MGLGQEQHEVVSALKELASELGHTPTLNDLKDQKQISKHQIVKLFGSFSVAIQAAGLELKPQNKRKVTNEIFERDIHEHLENYKPEIIVPRTIYPKIAILGDLHEPFSHDLVKSEFKLFCEKHQPDYIIQIGDAYDQYSHAKFPRSHNIFTPKDEEFRARRNLEELWKQLIKVSPKSKCVQLCGNHDLRVLKRVLEQLPSMEHWAEKYLLETMSFDGVETIIDPRNEYLIGDIAFIHGYRSKIGNHRDYMMMNAVVGHSHTGGVSYRQIKGKTLFELNAGYAADPASKGLSYTNQRMNSWTLGFGYIDAYGARFIHL